MFAYASIAALRAALDDLPEGADFVAIENEVSQETIIEFFTSDEATKTVTPVARRNYALDGSVLDTSVVEA